MCNDAKQIESQKKQNKFNALFNKSYLFITIIYSIYYRINPRSIVHTVPHKRTERPR